MPFLGSKYDKIAFATWALLRIPLRELTTPDFIAVFKRPLRGIEGVGRYKERMEQEWGSRREYVGRRNGFEETELKRKRSCVPFILKFLDLTLHIVVV